MDANSPRGLAALAGPPIPNISQPPPSDVPREPPFDISQQPPPPPPPSYRLYDSKRVTLATFLGTPLAGGWLMALNYRRLGQRRQFWTCIILTIVGTGTFFALCALIPDSFPSTPVAAASIFAMSGIARIQAAMIEQHKARGGRLGSLWEAAGVGLVPLVLIGGVICVFVFQEMNRYSKFTFRAGEEVLYEEQATAADAQKLAESLEKARIFDGKGEKTVVLVKNTNGAIISFVISQNSANTPATIDAFRKFGQELEAGGFDKHVVIRFCDRNLKLLREIK